MLRSWPYYHGHCEDDAVVGLETDVICLRMYNYNDRVQTWIEMILTPDPVLLIFLGFVLFKSRFPTPIIIVA